MNYKYDIYCSYESKNSDLVHKISDGLVRISNKKIWIDKNRFNYGPILHESIQDAITNSELILAFVTKKYFESNDCQLEISFCNRIGKKV